jgi:hypothetical protein
MLRIKQIMAEREWHFCVEPIRWKQKEPGICFGPVLSLLTFKEVGVFVIGMMHCLKLYELLF